MAKRTIYLHLGTHKTGTSSIQRLMKRDEAGFRASGIAPYIEEKPDGRRDGNAVFFAHAILRRSLNSPARLRNPAIPAGLGACLRQARLLRALFGSGRTILISAEGLCFCRTRAEAARLRLIARLCGARIVPVLVLRERAAWQASWTDQLQKEGIWAQVESDPSSERINAEWYYDQSAIRRFWDRIGPTITLDYDQALAREGSIISGFLRGIGLDPAAFDREIFANRRRPEGNPVRANARA